MKSLEECKNFFEEHGEALYLLISIKANDISEGRLVQAQERDVLINKKLDQIMAAMIAESKDSLGIGSIQIQKDPECFFALIMRWQELWRGFYTQFRKEYGRGILEENAIINYVPKIKKMILGG